MAQRGSSSRWSPCTHGFHSWPGLTPFYHTVHNLRVSVSLEKLSEGEMEPYFSSGSHLAANIITYIQECLEYKLLKEQQVLINPLRRDGVENLKLRDEGWFTFFPNPDSPPPHTNFSFSDLLELVYAKIMLTACNRRKKMISLKDWLALTTLVIFPTCPVAAVSCGSFPKEKKIACRKYENYQTTFLECLWRFRAVFWFFSGYWVLQV